LLSRFDGWHGLNIQSGGSAQRPGEGDQRAKRVLIVHDHDLFREALALMLEWAEGFTNVQARSLAEARQRLLELESEVDLAIVDLDLLDEDGVNLIAQLRRAEPRIPVLALTRRRGSGVHDWALKVGVDQVLTAAASGEEITDAIRRLVGFSTPLPLA
jgi:DNA-binding NarL/FixJ family response regulator